MPTAPKIVPLAPTATAPPRKSTTGRGYGTAHQKQRKILLARFPTCQRCGEDWSVHLHHIDRDPFNRDPANLVMLCERCHRREHAGE